MTKENDGPTPVDFTGLTGGDTGHGIGGTLSIAAIQPQALVINIDGKNPPQIVVGYDGEVILRDGFPADEAAAAFWQAVERYGSSRKSENDALKAEVARLKDMLANPPKHVYWRAGEPDCPKAIKAGNGELHTMRCKVCGLDNPRGLICLPIELASRPNTRVEYSTASRTVETWEGSDAANGEG